MPGPIRCADLEDRLREAGETPPTPSLQAHLDVCGACARLVRRERRLVRLLGSLPSGSAVRLDAPRLPDAMPGRLAVPRWAAAAAAVLAAAAIAARWAERETSRLRIERVVDVADAPPPVDERLLALTGGLEAVAMRRPTEAR